MLGTIISVLKVFVFVEANVWGRQAVCNKVFIQEIDFYLGTLGTK